MSKFRLYIDEVGNHDLGSSKIPNERFLSLTGVAIDLDYVQSTIHPELEQLKVKYFGQHPDEPIVLHRTELRSAKYPFHSLKDSYIRTKFDIDLLRLLSEWDYTVITVCLDKKSHMETYSTWRHHPYHYCLEILLERYIFFLDSKSSVGDVLAESRGGKEDRKLKDSFSRLIKSGTNYLDPSRLTKRLTSCQLKVKPKANNIAGLQIADILAHPSRNEILQDNGISGFAIHPFTQQIINILQSKYYKNGSKVYGKKFQ